MIFDKSDPDPSPSVWVELFVKVLQMLPISTCDLNLLTMSFVYSYRSILQLVKPWYDEVKDYSFPYPRDCNPRCPLKCYGPMCTHYTQVDRWLKLCVTPMNHCSNVINWQLIFIFADGVGNIQQSRLCYSHMPQYECMGFSVETGNIFSLQLFT